MVKNNGVIGVQEKRELSKLIDEEFSTIIQSMKQEIAFTEGELLEEAQKKFGYEAMDKEIEHLKDKIKFIEDKQSELGFDSGSFKKRWVPQKGNRFNNDQEIDPTTKAGRFYYLKVARNVDIRELEKQKSDRLKRLWLLDQRADVTALVNETVDMKLLSKPKK